MSRVCVILALSYTSAMAVEFQEVLTADAIPGWEIRNGPADCWVVKNGVLTCNTQAGKWGGWISTQAEYTDFILELEFKVSAGGNSGVYLRTPKEGHPSSVSIEVQILDDEAEKHKNLKPAQYCGSLYKLVAPAKRVSRPAGQWNRMGITARGDHIIVEVNGEKIIDADSRSCPEIAKRSPRGFIGLQDHHSPIWFRNIRIADLSKSPASQPATTTAASLKYETVTLNDGDVPATVNLAYRPGSVDRHPAILMLGSLKPGELPVWSAGLVNKGYMLVAFSVAYPPDPDPARRPQWLFFDQRFAHSYVQGGYRAARDAGRVVEYLTKRGDVHPRKIGWMGSSSTGIPGLAVATRGPRLAAVMVFVSTGAYRQWLETWHTNGLWRGQTRQLWPETEDLLTYDPILHVDKMFPTAVLMVSGGNDKVVDPKTARAFVEAAKPYYQGDPDRLRLVVYDGFGHNLPADIVKMYIEHWFHLYMHPTQSPPEPPKPAANLNDSVIRTQINAADHQDVTGAK